MKPFTIYNKLSDATLNDLTGLIRDMGLPSWSEPYPMHHTLIYSKNPKEDDEPVLMNYNVAGKYTGAAILGDALVILFDAPDIIKNRFAELNKKYGHSFPSLLSHVSILYIKEGEVIPVDWPGRVDSFIRAEFGTNFNINLEGEVLKYIEDKAEPESENDAKLNSESQNVDESKRAKTPREEFLSTMHKYLSDKESLAKSWGGRDIEKFKEAWRGLSNYMVKVLRDLAEKEKEKTGKTEKGKPGDKNGK